MEAWPNGVPSLATIDSQQVKPHRDPLQTDMEDGQQRRRRSTTKNIATVKFTVRMTNAQFSTFKAWERDTLVDGILQFTALIYTEASAETKTCSFSETYADDPTDGTAHNVSMTLDVEDF